MINIVAKRMWFLSASTVILIVGILSLLFPPHLNLGIDFLSGTGVTVKFENDINSSQIESQFNKIGLDSPSIQSMGDKTFFIRTEKLSDFDVENNDSTVSISFINLLWMFMLFSFFAFLHLSDRIVVLLLLLSFLVFDEL